MLFYIGTYTSQGGEGIYSCQFDPASGALSNIRPQARTANPTYLCLHPTKAVLYAANEVAESDGEKTGAVSAYAVAADGALTPLNQQPSHGTAPCYVSVDATGRWLLVANYSSGSVAVLPVEEDGSLGPAADVVQHEGIGAHPRRQEGPHAHFIRQDPAGRFVLACDLGTDEVKIYRLDAERGTLTPNNPPALRVAEGQGPRHLAFHPNGRWVYVINELGSTMTACTWDAERGILSEIGTVSTLPDGYLDRSYCAEVHVAPSGRYVYGSNRGHDSIAIMRVDAASGMVRVIGFESTQGSYPRNFYLSPEGDWLLAANQKGDSIVSYWVDVESGLLRSTGHGLRVSMPVCLLPGR